ncbi:unnamed protein product [Brassica oleracea var. botrytis]
MNLILTSVVAVFKPPVTVMMMSWIIKRTYEIHVGPIPAATKHFSVGYVEVEGIVVNEMTSCSGRGVSGISGGADMASHSESVFLN